MTLVEELGQVSYIFTDKTGTLTKNEMAVKSMTVGLEYFGFSIFERNFETFID
jgi:P-type E1-E2 ATPase